MEHIEHLRRIAGASAEKWTESHFREADENLQQYLAIALRVFERLESDPTAMAAFEAALTAPRGEVTINNKGREK